MTDRELMQAAIALAREAAADGEVPAARWSQETER